MKKTTIIIITAVIIAMNVFAAYGLGTDDIESVEEINLNRSIRIAADNRMPPYSYVNDNGIFKGFYIDVIQAISIESGIDIELYPMSWEEIEEAVAEDEIDGVIGVSDEFSDLPMFYSDTLLTGNDSIFVKHSNTYIVNLEDLRHSKVAIQKNHYTPHLANYMDEEDLVFIENQQQGIQMIMMGQVDAFIGDKLTGLYTIQKWKQDNFIKIVGDPINKKSYKVVFLDDYKKEKNVVDKALARVEANGTYEKIYKKWFGELVDTDSVFFRRLLYAALAVIAVGFIVVGLVIRWNRALKYQVDLRTADLTEANLKLTSQKSVLENNDRFKEEILNSLLSGIVTINKDKKITAINLNGQRILDKSLEDLKGRYIEDTLLRDFFIHFDERKVLEKGDHIRQKVIELVSDDMKKTYNCNLFPLKNSRGEIGGMIFNFRDISRDIQIQEELKRKDRMRSLGLMTAGMAHEIRNPLTSIKAMTDLLPYKYDNENYREKLLEIIPDEIDRLNSLIDDLLDFGKPKIRNVSRVNLEEMARHVIKLLRKKLDEKGINVNVDMEEGLFIDADRHQVQQVFINLFLNCIQALSPGGNIGLRGERRGRETRVVIEDDGKGIKPEDLEHVMDPFYSGRSDGTGLGLFICYQLVMENGGTIDIESQVDKYTRIILTFEDREDEDEEDIDN